jgi:hypothetical protein
LVSTNPANYTPNVKDDGVSGHSAVYAQASQGNTIWAGGKFARVTNASGSISYNRSNLMSFDATNGAMNGFAPNVNGQVWAIEVSGSSLYVGGTFSSINGVQRQSIAKIDATTGAVDTAFNANLAGGRVSQIRLVNGRLFVSGLFSKKLVALDPSTGANTGYVNLAIKGSVSSRAGATEVYRFAVSPDGSRLVGVGNFTSVGGASRTRVFMLDLGGSSASVDPWFYQPFENMCAAASLADYMRDVDFSSDGSFFVVVSTGFVPQSGGIGRDVCDAAARFETNIASPARPTWINYTGGDTLHSTAVSGGVVYVQGHQRWLDNPFGRDNAGPGAVSRQGIGAIDATTGKALSWNPSKTRGVGGRDLLVTPGGLWVASDGARFNGEYHDNIAFAPLP